MLCTRMTTLTFILSSYFPLMVSAAISCLLLNLKTIWNILMILYSYVEKSRPCVAYKNGNSVILPELFPLDHFRSNLVSAL